MWFTLRVIVNSQAFKQDSQIAVRLLALNILASLSICEPSPTEMDTMSILQLVTQYLQKNPRFKRCQMPYHLTKTVESVALRNPKLFARFAVHFMPQLLKLLLHKWSYVHQKVLSCLSVLSRESPLFVLSILCDKPILGERITAIYTQSSVKAIAPPHVFICRVVLHLCKAVSMGQSLELLVDSTLLMAVVTSYGQHTGSDDVQQCIEDIVGTVLLHAPLDYVDYIFPAILPVVHVVLYRYNRRTTSADNDRVSVMLTALLRALTDQQFNVSYRALFIDLARDAKIFTVLVNMRQMRGTLGGLVAKLCGALK